MTAWLRHALLRTQVGLLASLEYPGLECLVVGASIYFASSTMVAFVLSNPDTMIASQFLRSTLPASEIKIWTRAEVSEVLNESLDGDAEASALINTWVDSARAKPIRMILACLGENTDLTGGTMGDPNIVSEHALVLHDVFTDILIENFGDHFDASQPMWSEREWRKRCFLDFLWKYINYSDD